MQTKIFSRVISLVFSLCGLNAQAATLDIKWSEVRIFGTSNTFSTAPTELNSLTATDNIPELKSMTGIGIEADGRFFPWLKLGTRVRGIWTSLKPANATFPPTSSLSVQQFEGGLIARIPLLERDLVQLDTFAEVGVSNNKIDIQTSSSGNGTFTKNSVLYQRAGASIGFGTRSFKLFLEGGQEWNNVKNMTFEGTLTNNLTAVDFSGPYVGVGIIISGIPSWIKPGSVSTEK
ncbi:MAG: hypothetical protein ACXWRU_19180 [Pseudobdellovibrionaceae bacterium]